MNEKLGDHIVSIIFFLAAIVGVSLAWLVSQDSTWQTFDVIQGTHVFDIDDLYRRFLAQNPFRDSGVWAWDYILPINVAYDGFLAWAFDDSVFLMRSMHFLVVLLGQFLVYRSGRSLGISPLWMGASCLVLLLMPFYLLHAMSFYGESLLSAVMGMVIYAIIFNRARLEAALISLFPLIRPEGFLYLFFVALRRLRGGEYRNVILMIIPGLVFLGVILFLFPFLHGFMEWRSALTSHYSLVPDQESVMGRALMPYYTINPAWWLLAFSGAFLPMLRPLRPLFLGAGFFGLFWAVACLSGTARGETRYFLSMLPLLSLSVAAMLHWLGKRNSHNGRHTLRVSAVLMVSALIVVENLAQIDPVRANIFSDRRWPMAGENGAVPFFRLIPNEETQWRKDTASFLVNYTQYDSGIKKIFVSAFPVFYDLDYSDFPDDVEIEFAPMRPQAVRDYFGNEFYAMFPSTPQYGFYRFSPVESHDVVRGGEQALYVGPLYNGIYPPLFANPLYQVYKVYYETVDKRVARP